MFSTPQPIDVHATQEVEVPESWAASLPDRKRIAVLPLAAAATTGVPGWCTAANGLDGPEIEVLCGGINDKLPSHAAVWRQGNLLHFGFQEDPSALNAAGRALLVNCIAYVARFGSDRPLIRQPSPFHPAHQGPWRPALDRLLAAPATKASELAALLAPSWSAKIAALADAEARAFVQARVPALRVDGQKFAFDDEALALGVPIGTATALHVLPELVADADRGERARALCARWFPDGPVDNPLPANWRSYLGAHAAALAFDPYTCAWRLDGLAQGRALASRALRGPARADAPATRAPAALALARRVADRAGGTRAFDDLHTLRADRGEVHFFWDRRQALLRIENHGQVQGLGTPWTTVIFDVAADRDVLQGGGPPPRPRVSGRGLWQEFGGELLLPLLLLGPTTELELLPSADADAGRRRLLVVLHGRGFGGGRCFELLVDPADGRVAAVGEAQQTGGPFSWWRLGDTAPVGPLALWSSRSSTGGRERSVTWQGLAWNPAPPDGAFTEPAVRLDDR